MAKLEVQSTPRENALPTLAKLGSEVPMGLSQEEVVCIASGWIRAFQEACKSGPSEVLAVFLPDLPGYPPFWRDILALTWDFRTFQGGEAISKFLVDRASFLSQMSEFALRPGSVDLQQPYPDITWIQAVFTFSTDHAECMGVVRLVPMPDQSWKAHTVFTNMQNLKNFPEMIGARRNPQPNHGLWSSQRAKELSFEDDVPDVVVIGSGHSGLAVAARLKYLGIKTLVIEKNPRIGDNWRNRYDALCLHDSVWMDHLPYLSFPPTWPVFTPALKLADWLESYANSLELNVWTSSTVLSAHRSELDAEIGWAIDIRRSDGTIRTFKHVTQLIMATGVGGGTSNFPKYPGMDIFSGKLLHSFQYKDASEHKSKKVFIIGSGSSGHDIAFDHCNQGIVDVTIFQRSPTYVMSGRAKTAMSEGIYCENGPPLEVADCLNASFPTAFMIRGLAQRMTASLAEMDKDLLDGLDKRGFKRDLGIDDTGIVLLAWQRAGGYYIDAGASQLIAEGRIKVKNDTKISRITEHGILFEDGSEIPADVIIFATGLGDSRETVRAICGDKVASECTPIWGLDAEGELQGCWREFGVPNLWYMSGGLGQCRFHSKHVALQIKAMQAGIYGPRYASEGKLMR
ncbi:FAD/NAD(P)-binding domain-containing protein [Athelia psychrophila]|uniref:FAD/NAD(P)-binding domain-containing protein n=1 Tax=Athelia psychrophila TaxID=1759441 RepID=A0A166SV13_9AGAM|nr:FAD/NAD(P)-binding domain-containing protein [Fibularhizoctonia sp. CBS 109695]